MLPTLPLKQFLNRVVSHPKEIFLHQPDNGQWRELSWADVDHQARCVAQGLLENGLAANDRVAIIAKNCAEWIIADIAIMMAGMISVPIYPSAGASTIRHILEHSQCKAIFIGKLDDNSAVTACCDHIPGIGFPYAGIASQFSWNDWLDQYSPLRDIVEPSPQDIMSICYTSGSSGIPKGVVLRYRHIAANAEAFRHYIAANAGPDKQRVLSYLPLAHIIERTVVSMASLYSPIELYFNDSLSTFFNDLKYARPTVFVSVPRLWVKFQAGILKKISNSKLQLLLYLPVIKTLVQRSVQRELGLDCGKFFACGSAPIAPDTLRWFARLGINISQGWGMTETCGATTFNLPFRHDKINTVGTLMSCYEMKIGDNAEILIRGDAVFEEYYRDKNTTSSSFSDGWFKTGDKGVIDSEGFLQITGRVKEEFKTAKGKYVAPAPIERMLAANTNIEQLCVCGAGRKQPIALVVLNDQPSSSVKNDLLATLNAVNLKLEPHQRLDFILVCNDTWTVENALLTPTLKLVRDNIAEKYQSWIKSDTSSDSKIIWESAAAS